MNVNAVNYYFGSKDNMLDQMEAFFIQNYLSGYAVLARKKCLVMKSEHLFDPIQIRGMHLQNRVVFPAMGTKMATDRFVTQHLIDYHLARAKGGNDLNTLEVCSVHGPSAPKKFLAICGNEYTPE